MEKELFLREFSGSKGLGELESPSESKRPELKLGRPQEQQCQDMEEFAMAS